MILQTVRSVSPFLFCFLHPLFSHFLGRCRASLLACFFSPFYAYSLGPLLFSAVQSRPTLLFTRDHVSAFSLPLFGLLFSFLAFRFTRFPPLCWPCTSPHIPCVAFPWFPCLLYFFRVFPMSLVGTSGQQCTGCPTQSCVFLCFSTTFVYGFLDVMSPRPMGRPIFLLRLALPVFKFCSGVRLFV